MWRNAPAPAPPAKRRMYTTEFLDIPPLAGAHGTVTLPGSKSISNRVLLLAALSRGRTVIHDLLDSDDTRVMLAALAQLGCDVTHSGSTTVTIGGLGGQAPRSPARLFMGNAGTAMRPLTAALAVLGGDFELSGIARMHERPIGDLVDALRQLGCTITCTGVEGYPPLRIGQPALRLDAPVRVRGDVSSQFLTALLMALPLAGHRRPHARRGGTRHRDRSGRRTDLQALHRNHAEPAGALRHRRAPRGLAAFHHSRRQPYQSPGEIHVEADASSASYFIALGALVAPGRAASGIRLQGVGAGSIQGDIRFVEAAQAMGARVTSGPNWLEIKRGAWPSEGHRPGLQPHSRRRHDAGRDGPVRRRPHHAAQHCQLARQGNRPDCRHGHASAQAGRHGGPKAPTSSGSRPQPAAPTGAQPASTPTTTTALPCVFRWRPSIRPACRYASKTPNAWPRHSRTTSRRCSHWPRPVDGRIPVICVDGPTASGKGTLAGRAPNAWATTTWIRARCTALPRTAALRGG
jgi:3-phosphoshikimate 1-carboxyvinyltransferase